MEWFRQLDQRAKIGVLLLCPEKAGQLAPEVGAIDDTKTAWVYEAITSCLALGVVPYITPVCTLLDHTIDGHSSRWSMIGVEWMKEVVQSIPDDIRAELRRAG